MSGEEINFTIDSVESSLLGAYVIVGENNLDAYTATTDGGYTAGSNDTDDADNVTIAGNGNTREIDIAANDSAKDVAKKINSVAGATTVFAQARTFANLASSNATSESYQISINGTQTAAFSISSNDVSDAVAKINAIFASTGVMASATTENKVLLTDSDGDDMIIANGSSGTSLKVAAVGNDGVTAQSSTAVSWPPAPGITPPSAWNAPDVLFVRLYRGSNQRCVGHFFCRWHCNSRARVSRRYRYIDSNRG